MSTKRRSRWMPRFSLRSMLCLITVLAVSLGLLVRPALLHKRAIDVAKTNSLSYQTPTSLTEFYDSGVRHHYWQLVAKLFGPDMVASPTEVRISNPDLTAAQLRALTDLKTVTELRVDHTTATDGFVRRLGALQDLEVIYLCNTDITDAALDSLDELKKLRRVALDKTNVTKERANKFRSDHPDADWVSWSARVSDRDAEAIRACARTETFLVECRGDVVQISPRRTISEYNLGPLQDVDSELELVFVQQPIEPRLLGADLLSGIANLKRVAIHGCECKDLEWLEYIQELTHLLVMETKVDAGFPNLNNLQELFVVSTPFTDADLHQIPEGSKIRSLCLVGSSVSDKSCTRVSTFQNLELLGLRRQTPISDAGFAQLGALKSLRSLELNSKRISSSSPIQGMVDLKSLSLNETRIDDTAMDDITKLNRLEYLNVKDTLLSTDAIRRVREIKSLKTVCFKDQRVDPRKEEFQALLTTE